MPDNIETPQTSQVEKSFDPKKMKEDVIKWVTDARTHYAERFTKVDEYVKRYEAKRSISGLMGWGDDPRKSPKDSPWNSCSDIGIPIEAFTIEGLLPRFLKVCYGAKPIVWVKGESEDDFAQAPIVQDALNYQVTKKIKIYRRMKNVFKNVVMAGDGIAKCVWEEEEKIINKVVYYVVNPETGEQYPNPQTGEPLTTTNDAEIPPINEQGLPQVKQKQILSETKKIYDGPKIYSRNIKQVIIPKDANTPEIDDLDWICDTYERTIDWCKRRVGDEDEGKFNARAVREMEEDLNVKSPSKENHNYSKILISEWHGRYDVNDDGLEEEVIVFIGSTDLTGRNNTESISSSKLLGWIISPYPKRPFFHYQIIPMDDNFYGKGVPEFLIGIRDIIDALFNQMLDRGSIVNNPPVIVPTGHDPDENPYGPGAQWPSDNPSAYRPLELPKGESFEFAKVEFLLALVQKLFGVTDYGTKMDSPIGSNRTATGIMSIIGEGNIKFDDMIRALQDVNEDLYDFIVQLNGDLLEDEFVYMVTGKENPFRKINKQGWAGNFDFESAGNSININREIEQNRATIAYKTAMDSYGKNPVITPAVLLTLTDNFFRAIDMRNVKLPTIEEVQQQRIKEMAMAIQEAERANLEGGQGGQAKRAPQGQQGARLS